jgi:hypothetical protein
VPPQGNGVFELKINGYFFILVEIYVRMTFFITLCLNLGSTNPAEDNKRPDRIPIKKAMQSNSRRYYFV